MAIFSRVVSHDSPRDPMPAAAIRWISAFCAAMVLMLGLLAASPELHARVHHDADHAGHTCAVTLFSQGLDHPAIGGELPLAPAMVIVSGLIPSEPQRIESVTDWLLPGRGPPVH